MADPKPWQPGDPCPNCESELHPVPPATPAQRVAATRDGGDVPIPPTRDHATETQIAELGDLHRCRDCGYQARVPRSKKPAPRAATSGDAPTKPARVRKKKPAASAATS